MKKLLSERIKNTTIYAALRDWPALRNWVFARMQEQEFKKWEKHGKPTPPPHIAKQQILIKIAKKYGLKIFVETGTYFGDMLQAVKNDFDQVYSIELSDKFYEKAKQRFSGDSKIKIIHGDSGVELKKLMVKLDQPVLYWLDGHYSAGITAVGNKVTPIFEELTHIFDNQQSAYVVIIDDVRSFELDPAYPHIDDLLKFIKEKGPKAKVEIILGSIQIVSHELIIEKDVAENSNSKQLQ